MALATVTPICHSASFSDSWFLEPVVEDLEQPLAMRFSTNSDTAYIAQRQGQIIRVSLESPESSEPILDLSDEVSLIRDGGLLGLELDNATNQLFIQFTRNSASGGLESVLERIDLSTDPPVRHPIFSVPQYDGRHNGTDLHFGHDGMLYIAMGDGGGRDDPMNNGQNPATVTGSILRIDPYAGSNPEVAVCVIGDRAGIPADNPFINTPGSCPEIWAYGLRSPWRFSFDRLTSTMYIGDVGQEAFDEVNQMTPSEAGVNFGWQCREGLNDTSDSTDCDAIDAMGPVLALPHQNAPCDSIVGGYRYRGQIPQLWGLYVFGDFCTGDVVTAAASPTWSISVDLGIELEPFSLVSFAENADGELFLIDINGAVYRLSNSSFVFYGGFER